MGMIRSCIPLKTLFLLFSRKVAIIDTRSLESLFRQRHNIFYNTCRFIKNLVPNHLLLSAKYQADFSLEYHKTTDSQLIEDLLYSVIIAGNAKFSLFQQSNNAILFEEIQQRRDFLEVLNGFKINKDYVCVICLQVKINIQCYAFPPIIAYLIPLS